MADSSDPPKSTRSQKKRPSKKDVTGDLSASEVQDGCHTCTCRDDITAMHTKLDRIMQSLDDICSRVSGIELKLQQTADKVTDQQKEIDGLRSSVSFLEDKCRSMTTSVNSLNDGNQHDIRKLETKIDDLQNRSRRNNIIILGIPEGSEGNKSCDEFVSNFFDSHMNLEDGSEIQIEMAHRTPTYRSSNHGNADNTPRPRPIHSKLLRYPDRQYLLKQAAKSLRNNPYKGSKIYISDDVTSYTRNTHKQLRGKPPARDKKWLSGSLCLHTPLSTCRHNIQPPQRCLQSLPTWRRETILNYYVIARQLINYLSIYICHFMFACIYVSETRPNYDCLFIMIAINDSNYIVWRKWMKI